MTAPNAAKRGEGRASAEMTESAMCVRALSDISDDIYWEQDAALRFTLFCGRGLAASGIDPDDVLGRTAWEHGTFLEDAWAPHIAGLRARRPFDNFVYRCLNSSGEVRYLSASGRPVFDAQGGFAGYRGTTRDVTASARMELRLAIEHAVTRALQEAEGVPQAMSQVIRVICQALGWSCGVRWESCDEGLRCAEAWGVDLPGIAELLDETRRQTPSRQTGGLNRRVWAERRPMWLQDVTKEPTFRRVAAAAAARLRSAFAFPIGTGAEVTGVMEFFSREFHQPDGELLDCMGYIGIQIGQFVQRKQAEEEVRASEERFRSLTRLSSDVYWEQDEEFRFTSFSRMDVSSRNLPPLGKKRWEQSYTNMTAEDWARHIAHLQAHKPFRDLELCRLDDKGQKVWVSVSGEPVLDAAGRFRGYRGVGKDITPRKLDEERIQYLANHDSLTALPNRAMFSEVLALSLHNARRYGRKFAVLFVDLDRFKVINDTLGHEAGDKLLKEVGERLARTVRASDVVARLGGDEFVILVQEVSEPRQAEVVARKLLSALMKPLYLEGQEYRITASIGISLYPADAQDEQALMKNADIAMYRAKEEGKNTYKFYSARSNSHSFERLALETSLRRGLERGEFLLHYQAKVDLRSGRITGVEALIRWQHPELGMVPPGQFIPLAEETGLILPIGKWVLTEACAQAVAWQRQGLPPIAMSVNISARQFADDSLLDDVGGALAACGLAPDLLELELTESMVVQNAERAASLLAALKKTGVRLAIDDFGIGYSSLTQLKRFPIDTLKVDRSFIRDIPQDVEDKAITEAIIAMGKSLNLTVIAEGVETLEQQTFLREHDCDEMQGYYFSKPIPAAAFAELLRARRGPVSVTEPIQPASPVM